MFASVKVKVPVHLEHDYDVCVVSSGRSLRSYSSMLSNLKLLLYSKVYQNCGCTIRISGGRTVGSGCCVAAVF